MSFAPLPLLNAGPVMLFDPLYFLIVGPFMLLAIYASLKVKSTFAHWSKYGCSSRMTGAEVARDVLRGSGINDVKIEMTPGNLSDHYDPSMKVLRLSPAVFNGSSLAAIGVAAHEAGHAIQHQQAYVFLAIRSFAIPTASLGSQLAWPLIFLGLFINSLGMTLVGIILFSAVVFFQLITLPVEFNASSRAKERLLSLGIIGHGNELMAVDKVLKAAAWTYVAATLTAVATLIYYILRSGILSGGRRD